MTEITDEMDLPRNWATGRLEDLIYIAGRIGWRGLKADEYTKEGPLFLSVNNLNRGDKVDFTGAFHISENRYEESLEIQLQNNDILLAKDGAGIGKLGIIKGLTEKATVNSSLLVIRSTGAFVPEFLYYFLKGPKMQRVVRERITGSATPHLFQRDIRKFNLRIPPIVEQKRIAEKIDELFTKVNFGVAALKNAKTQLKRYRQSVLKAAVTGELTREWREAHKGELEPAAYLLARILQERRAKWEADQLAKMQAAGKPPKNSDWKLKYQEPAAPETNTSINVPETWTLASAEQLTSVITDGEHITPERATEGILLLSARNVQDGYLSLNKVDYIKERVYAELSKRLTVESGDVLLSCSGSVGRSCVVPKNLKFALVRSVAVLKPMMDMGSFLSYALRSPFLQAQIDEKKTQTAQANIFQGKIRRLVFPLPPLFEQEKVVEEVERLLSIADAMEQTVEQSLKQAERLRQSILQRAFAGKLVPQDPADEPASVLLERIRQERAARDGHQPRKARARKQAKPSGRAAKQIELIKGATK